ncbi:hypothetical protein LOTGIDRAFT_230640 [Lottia gigantea]|uniref:Uncharacterized protein n=1 Tax=Lottia gigantea TaxID=225164 RepID=V4B5J4_LOTGI|nr:hypothetical protein LOTGIDRAFT_230640 [Lottia gigantea]ESP01282.1 hypothetical protein LOTGIDRAFT_230640 [Lottia gigantea]
MDKLLPTRFLMMFKSMNVSKPPSTWKIEECNSQIVVTITWDGPLESASTTKSEVGESDEVDVLNVSTGSSTDAPVNGQHEVPKQTYSNMAVSGKAWKMETKDIDIEIVDVDTDDDKLPDLVHETLQQSPCEIIDSQGSNDDVIIIEETGNEEVTTDETSVANGAIKSRSSYEDSTRRPKPMLTDLPSKPFDDMAYCGRRPRILKKRHEPLTEEEMKWELKRFTLCLRSDMGTRKLPLEHYVELHRQKLIMLNNWFLCRKAEGKITNCYPKNKNRKISKRCRPKKFQKLRKRPNFLKHAEMTLTVEEVKREIEIYRAKLLQEHSEEPKELPIDYYVGKYVLRINRLNRWFADKKKWIEENVQGVWWKAPAVQVASPGGTSAPANTATTTNTCGNISTPCRK